MEMYEINTEYLKKCLKVVSKDLAKYYLTGVFIHDKDDVRHYIGTNGHILVHCKEKFNGDSLKDGIIIRPASALGTRKCLKYIPLKIYDEKTAVLEMNEKRVLCDIIDGRYPNYEAVIPTEVEPEKEYVAFAPEYLLEMKRILGSSNIRPLSSGVDEPHIFKIDDEVEVVIMPVRI